VTASPGHGILLGEVSQQNVEIVQSGYEYFREGVFTPDFVWDMSTFRGWPERQTYQGLEGARAFIRDWVDAWDDWEIEVESLYDAGDKVAAILRQRGRSKTTGLIVDMQFGQPWTLRDGRQVRMQMYASAEETLEAAGLTE
jgi:ketosteroid isomerase-like protein